MWSGILVVVLDVRRDGGGDLWLGVALVFCLLMVVFLGILFLAVGWESLGFLFSSDC